MNGLTVKTSLSSLKGILDSQQEPKILILQHGTMHQTNTLERLQKEFMASRSILQQKPTTANIYGCFCFKNNNNKQQTIVIVVFCLITFRQIKDR